MVYSKLSIDAGGRRIDQSLNQPQPLTPTKASPRVSKSGLILGLLILTVVVVFLSLIPKPENDLFFELRIGADILSSGHLPHFDTYSWTNRGIRWDVPEWLSFVIYAAAYRQCGFFGVWLVMVSMTVLTVWTVWLTLAPRLGFAWAFQLTNLMALALSDYIQERPYVYTYLFLALSLSKITKAREGRLRLLLWLIPICAVWTNLHQGVLVLVCILAAYTVGDLMALALRKPNFANEREQGDARRRALWMAASTVACALAAMASPYGWRVYWNVYITLRDRTMMSNVTEWNSIAVVPPAQIAAFLMIALLTLAAVIASRKLSIADALVLGALFVESMLHARNTALFAVAAVIVARPHFEAVVDRLRRYLGESSGVARNAAIGFVGVLYLIAVCAVGVASLKPAIGPQGYSVEGIGEAVARVPSYPSGAVDFVRSSGLPSNMRVFNNFSIGGYLMWTLPSQPDFVDGRLDVFAGRTFDDMLVIDHGHGSPAWVDLVRTYDLDCVITTSRSVATAFAGQPDWAVVYADEPRKHHSRCVVLLRRRPKFASVIAKSGSIKI